jgi:putative DNA primase/helicase
MRKGGDQRGTSRREDVLDTVIRINRPDDYNASEGARFNVTSTKARGLFGDDTEGF